MLLYPFNQFAWLKWRRGLGDWNKESGLFISKPRWEFLETFSTSVFMLTANSNLIKLICYSKLIPVLKTLVHWFSYSVSTCHKQNFRIKNVQIHHLRENLLFGALGHVTFNGLPFVVFAGNRGAKCHLCSCNFLLELRLHYIHVSGCRRPSRH